MRDLRSRRLASCNLMWVDPHNTIRNGMNYMNWKAHFGPRNAGPRRYGHFEYKQHVSKLFRNNTFGAKDQMKFKAEKLEKLKKNE